MFAPSGLVIQTICGIASASVRNSSMLVRNASAARLPLGDVGDNPGETDQLVGGIPDLKAAHANPADFAVGPHDAILDVADLVRLP